MYGCLYVYVCRYVCLSVCLCVALFFFFFFYLIGIYELIQPYYNTTSQINHINMEKYFEQIKRRETIKKKEKYIKHINTTNIFVSTCLRPFTSCLLSSPRVA